eukprot:172561-Pelagomonas_calceolata.AAC.4
MAHPRQEFRSGRHTSCMLACTPNNQVCESLGADWPVQPISSPPLNHQQVNQLLAAHEVPTTYQNSPVSTLHACSSDLSSLPLSSVRSPAGHPAAGCPLSPHTQTQTAPQTPLHAGSAV